MKYVLLLAGLSSCLLADPGVQGPSLGYISTAGAVRKVLGLAGAAQLSNPLVADLQQAVVLPGKSIAAAVDASGLLVRIDLTDGTVSSLGISEVTWITPSPSGETFVAVSGGRAYIFAKSGERRSDVALPGDPLMIAVSDRELNVAVTIAEADGEALHILNHRGASRLHFANRLPALAFLPNSSELIVSDERGVISRIGSDTQFRQVTTVPGARALAVNSDHSRLLIAAGQSVRVVRLATGEETSVNCSCAAVMALPLGGSNFLLTRFGDGPMWLVDVSADELRVAFIPEAVNE